MFLFGKLKTETSRETSDKSCSLPKVVWRTLKAPQGLLGGIGRRVSTLIWGGAAATGGAGGGVGEAKLVQV